MNSFSSAPMIDSSFRSDRMNPSAVKKTRVVFLIRSLFYGGAERQLFTLASRMDKTLFEPIVMCYYTGGELEEEFVKAGVQIISLEKKGRWDTISFFIRLRKQILDLEPDILHSYLSMSNILAAMVKLIHRNLRIVFGVRYAYVDFSDYDWLTRLIYRLEIRLSWRADLIIVNSFTGKKNHTRNGFASRKMVVIPNGIDTEKYCLSQDEGHDLRSKLGITPETRLIGIVGRLDPVKDHNTFLKAASIVLKKRQDVEFVCVGDGEDQYRVELENLTEKLGIAGKIHWLEGQKNVRAVYNALDICCSASIGESFSNVIAEAMACGVPCVVTNVGDSAVIVDDCGEVVPAGDPDAMANGMNLLLDLTLSERRRLGEKSRQRIADNFSVERMVRTTQTTLINLTKGILTE
jgi:glycosyltransferase involved in cell wall biosynthesis